MFYGKLVAGLLGLLVAGPLGLLIGLLLGHFFDRGLASQFALGGSGQVARVQRSFFETTFLLLGCIAKADGRVSKVEIDHTEALFKQLRLGAEQRREAIALFKRGSEAGFDPAPVVAAFVETCRGQRLLTQTLLFFLVSLALADHALDAAERRVLGDIAAGLGYSEAQLEQLLRMTRAQEHFHGAGGASAQPGTSLEDAYAALGVSPDVDDRALKRAYRKLMSEHHPDKLIAKGVPEEMLRVGTERAQEIQAAYDMIRRDRDGR